MAGRWPGLGDSNLKVVHSRKRRYEEEWGDEDEEDAQLSLEALRVLGRLKDIDCPFLEGLYITGPRTIKQFLCTPSIYRLLIVEWLFARLYPSFGDSFAAVPNSGAKAKITEMTRLGHELMLCGPNDQDLITGSTGVKEQLYFFSQLLDQVMSLGPEYVTSFFSVEENFRKLAKDNEMLLKKIFNSRVHKILDSKLNPLPVDIKPSHGTKENLHRMPLEAKMKVEELFEKLTKHAEMLQAHKGEFLSRLDSTDKLLLPSATGRHLQGSSRHGIISSQGNGTLALTLSDFHHLVTGFIHVFEDELHEHCNRPAPDINQCGPFFHSVHENLTLCNQELKAINEIMDTSMKVEDITEQSQQEKAYLGEGKHMVTLVEKLKELKQKYKLS
ncbi:HAUS augmin-like complex subunit 7 [Notamacropus eugenii]|uniref:HAUS augmin-like complex subunit 7 n=1 Tax=Notamacropus eugenii TaxID=9315 RepID=UPI003B6748E1